MLRLWKIKNMYFKIPPMYWRSKSKGSKNVIGNREWIPFKWIWFQYNAVWNKSFPDTLSSFFSWLNPLKYFTVSIPMLSEVFFFLLTQSHVSYSLDCYKKWQKSFYCGGKVHLSNSSTKYICYSLSSQEFLILN